MVREWVLLGLMLLVGVFALWYLVPVREEVPEYSVVVVPQEDTETNDLFSEPPLSAPLLTPAANNEIIMNTTPFTYIVFPVGATLSPEIIENVFALLESARQEAITSTPEYKHPLPLSQYVYQLSISESFAAEQTVGVKALPPRELSNPLWNQMPLLVHDGGVEYFDALIDLKAQMVVNFYVHGEG